MYIMEENDNAIKKFKCQQCENDKHLLIYKNSKSKCGYICESCWNLYEKRMAEILFKRRNTPQIVV